MELVVLDAEEAGAGGFDGGRGHGFGEDLAHELAGGFRHEEEYFMAGW